LLGITLIESYHTMPQFACPKTRSARRAFPGSAVLAATLASALGATLAACAVSQQQEVQMGAKYSTQIAQQLPLIRDPESLRYIKWLGDSLARTTDDRNLEWHFSIVDSKEVNAFAVPGGWIYVNRGLIERATNMSQLAGVIGHEIGHVTQRHSIKQIQKGQGANIGMTLACILTNVCTNGLGQAGFQVVGGGIFAKFSRNDEAEADREGVRTLIRAGIDPHGIPEMFRILLDERKARPGAVDEYFATHPMEEDRIAATNALIAQYPAERLQELMMDSPEFQDFKRHLMGLPPSPETKRGK
jgi:predicted Zn-dependent protease